jgi:hypothetical protein
VAGNACPAVRDDMFRSSPAPFVPGKAQRPEAVRRVKVTPLTRRRRARAGSPNSPAIEERWGGCTVVG